MTKQTNYKISAYCPRRQKTFNWTTGLRGIERLKMMIKAEGLIRIKVIEIEL
jgi:hypothetical protein